MPQEPKKRHSRARQGKRRAHIRLKPQKGILCPNCSHVINPHIVCRNCGYYNGKQALVLKPKKEKKNT